MGRGNSARSSSERNFVKRDSKSLQILNPEEMDFPFAENIMKPMSWSRLDSYMTCPRKYQLNYHDHQPQGFSMPLSLGSAIHDSMEEVVNRMKAGTTVTVKDVDIIYANALDVCDPDSMLTREEVDEGRTWLLMTFKRVEKILDGDLSKVLGIESGFKYIIGIGIFEGWIDLTILDKDDQGEFIHIIDYKSGKAFDKNNKRKSMSRTKYSGQMKLYTAAMRRQYPNMRVKASLFYLRHDLIDTHEFTDEDLSEFEVSVWNTLADMVKAKKYEPKQGLCNSVLCAFCSYATKDLCPRGEKAAKIHKAYQDKRMFAKKAETAA